MGDYTEKATLDIYYDNPNEASNMYLKWLTKDCEANEIDIRVYNNIHDYCDVDKMGDGELFLEPTIVKGLEMYKGNPTNVDNPSATAQGIYDVLSYKPNTIYKIENTKEVEYPAKIGEMNAAAKTLLSNKKTYEEFGEVEFNKKVC